MQQLAREENVTNASSRWSSPACRPHHHRCLLGPRGPKTHTAPSQHAIHTLEDFVSGQ